MSGETLRTYLNDHLAGSVAAVELLDHLMELDEGRKTFYLRLKSDIQDDQAVLKEVLNRAGGTESTLRKTAAWLSEKLSQMKIAVDDAGDNQLSVLQSLEILALGIQGKLLLWRALGSAAPGIPALASYDYRRLQGRAQAQFEVVETERLKLAGAALPA
jgi:hypothetical protein